MRKRFIFCALGFLLVFLPFQGAGRAAAEDQIFENISKLVAGLELMPQSGSEQVKEFMLVLLDSILLVSPQAGLPENMQSEIEGHRDDYKETSHVIIHEDGVKSLWEAARLLDPDFDLELPAKPAPETIKEDIRLELLQARSFNEQGKDKRVIEILLRTVLRIVTPVRK